MYNSGEGCATITCTCYPGSRDPSVKSFEVPGCYIRWQDQFWCACWKHLHIRIANNICSEEAVQISRRRQSGVNLQIVCTIKIELFTCYLELWWQKKQHRIWKTTRKGTTFFSIMYLQFRTSWIAFPAVTLHAIIVAIKLQFFFVVGTKQFPANKMSNTSISIFCQLCIKLSATHMSI